MQRLAIIALLLVIGGCGGGGIKEGMPSNAGELTAEQQKEHDALMAEEEAAMKAQAEAGPRQ